MYCCYKKRNKIQELSTDQWSYFCNTCSLLKKTSQPCRTVTAINVTAIDKKKNHSNPFYCVFCNPKMWSIHFHPRCRYICVFIWTDLEKFNIKSLAQQCILCSEWVPSEWGCKQLINNPKVRLQYISYPFKVKSCLFVRNKSIKIVFFKLKLFLYPQYLFLH